MEINYKVLPTFAKVHQDPGPYIFVMGPVGSGKSSGCIFQAFLNAMRQVPDKDGVRHSRHLVVRATYPALKSTTINSWIDWFKDKITITYSTPIVGKIRYPLSDGTTVDMVIYFIAVDDDRSAEKLRSLEVTSAHLNEASELTLNTFQIVKTRVNRFPAEKDGGAVRPFIIFDYNAVSTEHWLYKIAEEQKPEGHHFYRQPPAVLKIDGQYVVNPDAENLSNLGKNYYENIIMGADDDFISVNLMNNYGEIKRGRPVYKDYIDVQHYTSEKLMPLHGIPVIIGIDQGLTPTAVFTQQQPDGSVMVFDEICTENCGLQEFAKDYLWPTITTKYPYIMNNFKCVCDPATAQRSMNDAKAGTQVLKEAGLPVKLAKSNVFAERREAVITFLRMTNKFKLGPNCPTLRKGFISEYKYDAAKTVDGVLYKEKPAKNNYSHPHDALQYAMMEYVHKRNKPYLFRERRKYTAASQIGGY